MPGAVRRDSGAARCHRNFRIGTLVSRRAPARHGAGRAGSAASPADAGAHAALARTDPLPGANLQAGPGGVRITVNEAIEPSLSTIRVTGENGREYQTGRAALSPDDTQTLTIALDPLPQGVYVVRWRMLSAVDGHVTAGRTRSASARRRRASRSRTPSTRTLAAGGHRAVAAARRTGVAGRRGEPAVAGSEGRGAVGGLPRSRGGARARGPAPARGGAAPRDERLARRSARHGCRRGPRAPRRRARSSRAARC